jgi:F0F1-type ATP synthase assembly protein I
LGENTEEEFEVEKMSDKGSWAIGGTTLIGIGIGFIFLRTSALFFVASVLVGVGAGLVIASLISRDKE